MGSSKTIRKDPGTLTKQDFMFAAVVQIANAGYVVAYNL